MKRAVVLSLSIFTLGTVHSAPTAHWGYAGAEGPSHWAELSPEYRSCSGRNQSPIDLGHFVDSDLPPITFSYRGAGHEMVNNGHTVQINFSADNRMQLEGREYRLLQLHFHAPSEHRLQGRQFPMEAHLVHADADGNLAVVAVLFQEGAENGWLDGSWPVMPGHAGAKVQLKKGVSADGLLPEKRDFYRYNGSLTTPPCSEGVRWVVMKQPVSASRTQIETFRHTLHEPNNRPVQPLNARLVLE